jgi:hypothetical protein
MYAFMPLAALVFILYTLSQPQPNLDHLEDGEFSVFSNRSGTWKHP